MSRLFTAFVDFVQKRLAGNAILAVIMYLFWFYGLNSSIPEAIGTAIVAFALLLLGDMISLYFSRHSAKSKKHAG